MILSSLSLVARKFSRVLLPSYLPQILSLVLYIHVHVLPSEIDLWKVWFEFIVTSLIKISETDTPTPHRRHAVAQNSGE